MKSFKEFTIERKIERTKEIEKIIEVPEANGMPLPRWEAYMTSIAISKGYHGRFSIGTLKGMSRITVYKLGEK